MTSIPLPKSDPTRLANGTTGSDAKHAEPQLKGKDDELSYTNGVVKEGFLYSGRGKPIRV